MMISSGMISETPGMLPAMKMTDPNSPTARAKASADPVIKAGRIAYTSAKGAGHMLGLLASPAKAGGKRPGVIVVHENRGLNPHIEDIARRVALENFVAFAPDALFPLGGYPGDEDKARELFPKLDQAKTREDFVTALGWLKARVETNGGTASDHSSTPIRIRIVGRQTKRN